MTTKIVGNRTPVPFPRLKIKVPLGETEQGSQFPLPVTDSKGLKVTFAPSLGDVSDKDRQTPLNQAEIPLAAAVAHDMAPHRPLKVACSITHGHFGQPVITHLPINLDVLRWNGLLPRVNSAIADALRSNFYRQQIEIAPFTLVPMQKVGKWELTYDVRHPLKSDPVAQLRTCHERKAKAIVQIEVPSEMLYHADGLSLAVEFWEKLEVCEEGLSYVELKGFSPHLVHVPEWIKASNAVKKNAKPASRTKNGRPTVQIGSIASNAPGQEIDPSGPSERMTVGHTSSGRRFSVYPFGRNAADRGKVYQMQFTQDNKAVDDKTSVQQVYAIEARIHSKEGKRCLVKDENGKERPIQTLREWTDRENVKAVFRTQIETGFDFRVPDPKRRGKWVDVPFFDWAEIGATRLTRTPRRKSLSYSAKQAVKRLTMDGREGDYLVKGLRQDLAPIIANKVATQPVADLLLDTLEGVEGAQLRRKIMGHWLDGVAEQVTGVVSVAAPDVMARRMAREYEVVPYYRKTASKASALPDVNRPDATLRTLKPARFKELNGAGRTKCPLPHVNAQQDSPPLMYAQKPSDHSTKNIAS